MKNRSKTKNAAQTPKASQVGPFPVPDAIYSIASLIVMCILSVWICFQLAGQAAWTQIPFFFTIFGGTLGWIFELGLLLTGTPYQRNRSPLTSFIQKIRFMNIGPVVSTLFFFVCCMVVPDANFRLALLYLAGATCFGLGAALFLGGIAIVPMVILGAQVAQFILVVIFGLPSGHIVASLMLMGQAIAQGSAFLVGTETPAKSTGFHVLSTVSALLLYLAIANVTASNPGFSLQVEPAMAIGSPTMWGFVVACLVGLALTIGLKRSGMGALPAAKA